MSPDRRLLVVLTIGIVTVILIASAAVVGSAFKSSEKTRPETVPAGYVATLEFVSAGQRLGFGPFVGYYFKPLDDGQDDAYAFICVNERSFYTDDLPADAVLFRGEARRAVLPDTGQQIPTGARIEPVFFAAAPEAWLATRPDPQEEYRHFHSCHDLDRNRAVRTGFWLRHDGQASFTYDMGGRVGPDSPLYHVVTPGVVLDFPAIIEFDHGPDVSPDS